MFLRQRLNKKVRFITFTHFILLTCIRNNNNYKYNVGVKQRYYKINAILKEETQKQ